MEKIETTKLVVDPFHTDFSGKLNWETLGKYLLNCAENHASARGFGMKVINDANYTWVLSRLTIEMYEMPEVYDEFYIDTWVESVYRLFTDRNYSIYGDDGKVYGYARSVWAMINYDDRQPADIHSLHGDVIDKYILEDYDCPISKPKRVKPIGDDKLKVELPVVYSDIDYNGHVNSIKYIEHIQNVFGMEMYKQHRLRRIEIAYMAETMYGNKMGIYVDDNNNGTFNVEVRKKNEGKSEPVVRSALFFE